MKPARSERLARSKRLDDVPFPCDATCRNRIKIRALFEQLDDEFGSIDVLANVAGGAGIETRPPEETPLEDVAAFMQSLVVGRFLLLSGSRAPHAFRWKGQHHQHHVDCRSDGAGTQPRALQHGHGGNCADDVRVEHRMGESRSAGV